MNEYQDIEIICICGASFIWTIGEQKFLNDLLEKGKIGMVIEPKRCIPCRRKKKEERAQFEKRTTPQKEY